ncbi:hypothetical protein [Snuella sedimenti]|uniref:Nuclear transport factor 2 family protein n=1 Tax=Snuella sedimenti TaxID=2798802 RepID=A0A8J7IMG7_9FLAO|nr:hypothetical protein [Snuella sedimenti]MBJ6367212.1 hypothetical protein [Snuella sedimenti]
MRQLVTILAIALISTTVKAQDIPKTPKTDTVKVQVIDSSKVLTLNGTIKALYKTISGEKEEERNWEFFKYLFHPDAKLIAFGKDVEGTQKVRYMSPNNYINNAGKWMVENGFIEKEIHKKVEVFGNIAHVFSTYEAYMSKADTEPFMRGINSIQLLNDGERWWIVNVFWAQETWRTPIPKRYLPN